MYSVLTTRGFVIGSRTYGDTSRIVSIFTREAGLVSATAQAVRLEKSKLRYHVQDYFLGDFSLVKGKEFWRLVGAESSVGTRGSSSAEKGLVARISSILSRLLHGEEAMPELFDVVQTGVESVYSGKYSSDLSTLESLIMLRILYHLGYVKEDEKIMGQALLGSEISMEMIGSLSPFRKEINMHINRALKESHL